VRGAQRPAPCAACVRLSNSRDVRKPENAGRPLHVSGVFSDSDFARTLMLDSDSDCTRRVDRSRWAYCADNMFHDIVHFQTLALNSAHGTSTAFSTCVGDNSCGASQTVALSVSDSRRTARPSVGCVVSILGARAT